MTAIEREADVASGHSADLTPSLGLDPCLARFDRLIDAARQLGIPIDAAETVRATAAQRLGFPSDAYVVALVGGTGVGKSSLLNALAGTLVSPASVRRPTTARPVAWLPDERQTELSSLLDWLGVDRADVHPVRSGSLSNLAVVDLPDLDSTVPDHRRRVEAVLPRVDAVIWVTDPEKYADAVLHDEFLETWLPRLDRQVVVLNKADRLTADEIEQVRRDLERDVARLARAGGAGRHGSPVVVATSTRTGVADGVAELRRWLAEQAEAKLVVRSRLRAAIRDAVRSVATEAGVSGGDPTSPVLDATARGRALEDAASVLLRIIDIDELQRQAVAATRARARGRGAGPLGGLTSLVYRWSGREARVADPLGFLARWRDRGSLGRAVDRIRSAVAEPLRTAPPPVRARLARSFHPPAIESTLARSVDRAVAARNDPPPSSVVWPLLGLLQTIVTLGLVATVVWVVLWVLVKFPVDSIVLPVVGRAPAPLVSLLALLAAGYVLARLLGAHAGWVGRRWARRLARDVRANVTRDVGAAAFADLDALDRDRARLVEAVAAVESECGQR